MRVLDSPVRNYAWGSHTVIARMQGRAAPTHEPEAELWMGAHSADPCRIDGVGLDKLIESAPNATIGADAAERFGPRLPFLLKLIAADAPLSIQAHPNVHQAATGYDAENGAGIDRLDPRRSFVDRHHKPELLVAHSSFEALCGLRNPAESADEVRRLGVPQLADVVDTLAAGDLRGAVELLLTWPEDARREVVARTADASDRLDRSDADMIRRLATAYPDDPGVILSLLLNHVMLSPGQAVYLPAGQLHAYLRGTGVEVMSSSDNVLRGGLTRKRVNVPALMSVVDFVPVHSLGLDAIAVSDAAIMWPTPEPDFRLTRVTCDDRRDSTTIEPLGPRILFCASGTVTAADRTGTVTLGRGCAAFSAVDGGAIRMHGTGDIFVASL